MTYVSIIALILGVLLGVGITALVIHKTASIGAELTVVNSIVVNRKDFILSLTQEDMDSLQVRKWALVKVKHVVNQ